MKTFHICTIVNNAEQYWKMRASFAQAGFDEDHCRFSVFDNQASNRNECYSTFNRVMAETPEPYVIYCHQDILLDQGHGREELLAVMRELDQNYPDWAIFGNAGVTEEHQALRRLHDPFGTHFGEDTTPVRVCSLDENFLVVKTASNVRCSAELTGFHLYATDLCLQAARAGQACYVVSFHLTHLSKGRLDQSFYTARDNFQEQWSKRFRFRYVRTSCTIIFFSRNRAIRFFFSSDRVTQWLLSNPVRHQIVCRFSDQIHAA